MLTRAFLLSVFTLRPSFVTAQGLDPSTYTLTDDAAGKYVRATQQMIGGGLTGPSMQGPGGMLKLALRPLVQAWEMLPLQRAEHWTDICNEAQRFLQPQ